jgi:tetratricopeptide (TPR) repeat protein
MPAGQKEFLLTVLHKISESGRDAAVVYPLLKQNLHFLDEGLAEVLRNWFAAVPEENRRSIALDIGNFGNRLQEFPLGNKEINMDLVITCNELLTAVFTIDTDPEIWATIQNNRAGAYSQRIKGDKAENLELAIKGYEAALQVHTRDDFPINWATTQNNRAATYSDRIKGDRAENLELAIKGYDASLQVRTHDNFPIQWAMTQNNRANAYSQRIKGGRAENLELAIKGYEAALQVITHDDFPIQWAMTQNNRANAYSDRIKGDRAENLELAFAGYEAALQVYTRNDFPIDWATTQTNLADAYLALGKEFLPKAIEHYKSALDIFAEESFPNEWISIHLKLASLSSEKIHNYQLALEHLQAAYECLTKDNSNTGLLAQTMFNLAHCFHKIGALESAKLHFKDAIRLFRRLEQPQEAAAATFALGSLALQMGLLSEARSHLQTALDFYHAAGNQERIEQIKALQAFLPIPEKGAAA